MNERIKELIEKCHSPVITDGSRYLGETFDHEKFAKLIIKDCIEIVNVDRILPWSDSIRITNEIKENFGVE